MMFDFIFKCKCSQNKFLLYGNQYKICYASGDHKNKVVALTSNVKR